MPEQINPDIWDEPEMRIAVAARDISTVYRRLRGYGVSQRQIGQLTGQSQSEVAEIIKGRQVMAYAVLERIADGLGIPRGYMGLAYSPGVQPAPTVEGQPAEEEEDVKRRNLIQHGGTMLFGTAVFGTPGAIAPPSASPIALPSRLGLADVEHVVAVTAKLRTLARAFGGQADTASAEACRVMRLLSVPASDDIKSQFRSAAADLHNLAGWCCGDSGFHDHAHNHFGTAMTLASDAEDGIGLASAMRHAGVAMVDQGGYNDGLKAFQLGQIKLGGMHCDKDGVAEANSWLYAESALTLSAMGNRAAESAMSAARNQWEPLDQFQAADMDLVMALVNINLGRLDVAEPFAASSVRTWAATSCKREGVLADIALARIHVQAGEPDGATLSERAVGGVRALRSKRARHQLEPLADALAARTDSASRDLAHLARKVSASSAA